MIGTGEAHEGEGFVELVAGLSGGERRAAEHERKHCAATVSAHFSAPSEAESAYVDAPRRDARRGRFPGRFTGGVLGLSTVLACVRAGGGRARPVSRLWDVQSPAANVRV